MDEYRNRIDITTIYVDLRMNRINLTYINEDP